MRVTIKGLTDSTIAFNTLGIILRGNSSKMEQYPGSVARSIDIKNDDQLRELITLKNAKLIEYIDENAIVTPPTQVLQPKPIAFKLPPPQLQPVEKLVFSVKAVEEIEDMPSKSNDAFDPIVPKKGRPKGSTKAAMKKKALKALKSTKETKETKETENQVLSASVTVKKVVPKPIKSIKGPISAAAANAIKQQQQKEPVSKSVDADGKLIDMSLETKATDYKIEEDESHIVIMTPGGPIKGEAINNMAGEIEESESTIASIEALKKLESEENAPDTPVDESKFDASDKMGGSAVIATGDNKMQKIPMKNSILPEADVIKKKPIQWIDPNGEDGVIEETPDEKAKSSFLPNDGDVNDVDDSFIEN